MTPASEGISADLEPLEGVSIMWSKAAAKATRDFSLVKKKPYAASGWSYDIFHEWEKSYDQSDRLVRDGQVLFHQFALSKSQYLYN